MTLLSTAALRQQYGPGHCAEHDHAGAQEAWNAHQAVMRAYGYKLRKADTGSRSCRPITGGSGYSLHAFYLAVKILLWNLGSAIAGAVACDFNWSTNPYGARLVTDMPRAMVDAICAIRTRSGAQVFRWGGYYSGAKDSMHYELVCAAKDLATGVDERSLPAAVRAPATTTASTQPTIRHPEDTVYIHHLSTNRVYLLHNGKGVYLSDGHAINPAIPMVDVNDTDWATISGHFDFLGQP